MAEFATSTPPAFILDQNITFRMELIPLQDIFIYILSGAGVGFAVGLTGVGGGSLMTPLLILFNYPAHIAGGKQTWYMQQ